MFSVSSVAFCSSDWLLLCFLCLVWILGLLTCGDERSHNRDSVVSGPCRMHGQTGLGRSGIRPPREVSPL
jgi:hypothetical protein